MLRTFVALVTSLLLPLLSEASNYDSLATSMNRTVQEAQLERVIHTSIKWLQVRALHTDYPALSKYTDDLQRVLKPACTQCHDYFEAVAILRSLGKTINKVIQDDRLDIHYPVIRRSYVAAAWILQRSKLFAWQTSQLQGNVLSTMFRLYVHHTNRAKGRAVSFHHISKCGGTTMCRLAAANRCSNPFMDHEKNCVLDSSLDGPVWMVAHDVSKDGVTTNTALGRLDTPAPDNPMANMTWQERFNISQQYAKEPLLPMWLMYQCPYTPLGKSFYCPARSRQAQDNRSTFFANERTLSMAHGMSQVCSQFTNAIILREPVPHVASLIAEVRFRYFRQLIGHNITSWQPPMWNITWWQTYGPALVGNYATRTLLGRDSFCRSAGSLKRHDLAQAIDALLGFDMVMTLNRARDIDVLVSTMLGWGASFSSQPASRVRAVRPKTVLLNWNDMDQDEEPWSSSSRSSGSSQSNLHERQQQQQQEGSGGRVIAWLMGLEQPSSKDSFSTGESAMQTLMQPVRSRFRSLLQQVLRKGPTLSSSAQSASRVSTNLPTSTTSSANALFTKQVPAFLVKSDWDEGTDDGDDDDDEGDGAISDAEFELMAAAGGSFSAPDPPPSSTPPPLVPPEDVESAAAVRLVKSSWQERQAHLWGFKSLRALGSHLLPEPEVEFMNETDRHGAFLVRVVTTLPVNGSSNTAGRSGVPLGSTQPNINGSDVHRVAPGQGNSGTPGSSSSERDSSTGEVWHAFPRHNVALTDADMSKLEGTTQLDHELVKFAGVLLDLDTIWLQSLLHSPHHRKRMKSVATTHTACGFAGMMPLADSLQDSVFQPDILSKSSHWVI